MAKDQYILIRVTKEEKGKLESEAKAIGVSLSTYLINLGFRPSPGEAGLKGVTSIKVEGTTGSSNGMTSDFDSDNLGSSLSPVTTFKAWSSST